MLSKFDVDPSKIDWAMLVDKQKLYSHVSYTRGTIYILSLGNTK